MILVSQITCTLSGGHHVGPFGEAYLGTADLAEYDYSAKGSATTVFTRNIRNITTGLTALNTHFPETDHKLLWKRLLIGYYYYGGTVNLEAVSLLKDNSHNWLGGNYDDPFTTDLTISAIGEVFTDDETKSLTSGMLIDLVQVRQESDRALPYYQDNSFRLPSAIWPLRAGIAVEMKTDIQLWPELTPDHADQLRDNSPLNCTLELWNEAGQPYQTLTGSITMQDNRAGQSPITIPAQWCHGTLTFRTRLIKYTQPTVLTSAYAGGTISFI